jgi:molybdopterin synthase catalytic subunit
LAVAIQRGRLSIGKAYALLEDPAAGGVVLFVGRVRADVGAGGRVRSLLYEADLRAVTAQLEGLERRARGRFGISRVVIWHRIGEVPVGEPSVLLGVAAAHRPAAFAAARYLIEALKARAAIWKTARLRPRSAAPVGGARRRSSVK